MVKRPTSDKDTAQLIERAERNGWQVERRTKHIRLVSPSGNVMHIATTPQDWRANRNNLARMKRLDKDFK